MKEIGQRLRQAREEKHLSISAAQAKTHITPRYLIALEEGNASVFPAEVYLVGSLKKYAEFLGLNADELIDIYRKSRSQTPAPQQKQAPTQNLVSAPKKRVKRGTVFVWAGAALVFALVVFIVVQNVNPPPRHAAAPSPAAVEQLPAAATATASTPVEGGVSLEITANQASWIKVMADATPAFEGTLTPGSSRQWYAKDKFSLVIGNAPGVSVKFNGKSVEVASGTRHDIKEITLSRENAG